jgi:hypothetical protein
MGQLSDGALRKISSLRGSAIRELPDRTRRRIGKERMHLFSKSSCTLVPHSETQSVLPHQGTGSSKTFRVFSY